MASTSTDDNNNNDNNNYVTEYLPPSIVEQLEAGAFKSLCTHLQERSEEVQNIDLMTVSGFCRNCLAKWMVIEARNLSEKLKQDGTTTTTYDDDDEKIMMKQQIVKSLDAMGYDEAAQYVYGMAYGDWKNRYSKKASDEQMEKFNASKPMWAPIDKQRLEKQSETPGTKLEDMSPTPPQTPSSASSTRRKKMPSSSSSSLLSNVCCQPGEDLPILPAAPPTSSSSTTTTTKNKSKSRELPPYQPPAPPSEGVSFSLGILTVSDRAALGEYETGDLSGPAVQEAISATIAAMMEEKNNNNNNEKGGSAVVAVSLTEMGIVPDEMEAIQSKLKEWADDTKLDLILTTGGTGFSIRDITPEATTNVVDRSCGGLVSFCTMETARLHQPLASLSRGTAGIRGHTLIANLPGNPKAVGEIIPILLPLALHAITDMKKQQQK